MKKTKFHYALMSLFIVSLVSLVLISGCIQESVSPLTTYATNVNDKQPQATSDKSLRSSNAKFIGNFVAKIDQGKVKARFSLMDNSKKYVAADGVGEVRIINSEDEIIYTGTFSAKEEDYVKMYSTGLTGNVFLAYVWEIPLSEIKKSSTSTHSGGTIYIKFKTKNVIFNEISAPIWGLPMYSEEELKQLNEEEFLKSAVSVNKKLSKGSFEATVKRAGFYAPLTIYGTKKEYFRVDMEIKNIGTQKETFFFSGLALLDNEGNQYNKKPGGTLNIFSEIYPDFKQSGYILFEKIPETKESIKLVFELGRDQDLKPYAFEYPLTYKTELSSDMDFDTTTEISAT